MYKIITEPIRENRHTVGFTAKFGQYSEKGETKKEAIEALERALDWYFDQLEYNFNTLYVQTEKRVFFLERDFRGFYVRGIYRGSKYTTGGLSIPRMPAYQAEREFNQYIDEVIDTDDRRLFD